EKKSPTPLENIDRIMVPIDFSDHSQTALVYAGKIARVYNSKLLLLHVVEDRVHPSFYLTGKQSIFEFMPEIKSRSKEQIEKMCTRANCSDVPSEIFIIEGMASRDLIKFAEENQTDLIVISTHGLSGIEHFFLGSIAEKVVRRSPCPVFTVKSFGKSLIKL
ncbi:MAG: universal stress protein, partial [bacterium]|nr:universal stress protein [bacterium]